MSMSSEMTEDKIQKRIDNARKALLVHYGQDRANYYFTQTDRSIGRIKDALKSSDKSARLFAELHISMLHKELNNGRL